MPSEIIKILKFYSIFTFPFGIRKLKYDNSTVQTTGPYYMIYVLVLCIFSCIVFPQILYMNHITTIEFYHFDTSLVVISTMTQSFQVFTTLNIMLTNLLNVKISKRIYENLILIDSYPGLKSNSDKIMGKLVITHAIFISTCFVQIVMSYLAWSKHVGWPVQSLVIIIEIEIIRFIFELELISKKFEMFNQMLKSIDVNNSNIDFDLTVGILQHVMQTKSKNIFTFQNKQNFLHIHNKLFDIVEDLNNCYSWKVFLLNIE